MALEREQVIDALRSVFDPEIPINVVDLGLIYGVDITDDGKVTVRMTMTAPQCPMSGYLTQEAEQAVRGVPGVRDVKSAGIVTDAPASPVGDNCPPDK
jgi:metal-sulfur cluster biosynthetic enzyme